MGNENGISVRSCRALGKKSGETKLNTLKCVAYGMITQLVILLLHLFIHMIQSDNSDFEAHIQILCSFIDVIFITYLAAVFLKLPIFTMITAQTITVLFILISEEEGVYLLYYLHKGSSQWMNPDIFTDAIIIVLEMLVIQLPSALLAKFSGYIYNRIRPANSNKNMK